MISWRNVYSFSGKGGNENLSLLSVYQYSDIECVVRNAYQGLQSEFMQQLYVRYGCKRSFVYVNQKIGLRYQFKVNRKNGSVTVMSIDADSKMMISRPGLRCA
ncbi:MAG: hypothetical protein Q4F21_01505 [Lachnospiraceae bacterium]|nr:hypothetical protein [Lachnospiraceae bacterium]